VASCCAAAAFKCVCGAVQFWCGVCAARQCQSAQDCTCSALCTGVLLVLQHGTGWRSTRRCHASSQPRGQACLHVHNRATRRKYKTYSKPGLSGMDKHPVLTIVHVFLCRNLARDASTSNLFGADSFTSRSNTGTPLWRSRGDSPVNDGRDSPAVSTTPTQGPSRYSSSSNLLQNSSGNNTGGAGRPGGGWGRGWGAVLAGNGGQSSGDAPAIGLQQFGAGTVGTAGGAVGGQGQGGQGLQEFAGFDASEENQGVFVLDGADGSRQGFTQQQAQQQQRWVAVQRASQPGRAAVELQQQQDPGADRSGMVSAMRHVGEVWGVFDRTVMQPVFGGPETARGSSQGANSSGFGHSQPPSGPPGGPL
jgi:hypothetical protein